MNIFNRFKKLREVKPVPEEERVKLEKSDIPAMLLAALITIFLPAALVLGGLVLVVMLLFQLL